MSGWIALLFAGLGCFGLRFGVVAVIDRWTLPTWLDRAAGFVMPASFAALCAVSLLAQGGNGPDLALPVAGVATALVGGRRSPALAVACGMAVIWSLDVLAMWR